VDNSVNTRAAHVCGFCETKYLRKNAKCNGYASFCGTNSHNRQAEDQPEVGIKKKNLPTPTTLDQTPSDYAGLVVVVMFKINSKYVGITHSLLQEGH